MLNHEFLNHIITNTDHSFDINRTLDQGQTLHLDKINMKAD